ncbi:SCO family protein [Stakelama marina]|uniref:SCO family protein n=1 Tax=Stakelama marina TaxID=2826939 RepID=A0A8T4IAB1_9SPHN|nr:SCO family protein [Stakelama marina]MBR0551072.1 SCO family protein [Stakelama marina]
MTNRPHPMLRSIATLICCLALAACGGGGDAWHGTDVSGSTPDLSFRMTRASDEKPVTAADYRGKIVLLYFGYTYCPDVCPLTLSHLGQMMKSIDGAKDNIRVLFVTVDPQRDTLDTLKQYTSSFGPEFVGLRGTDNQLASLAKRYRVAYSADPDNDPAKYVVTHSSAVYVFDRQGNARLLFTDLSTADADLKGPTADLRRLLSQPR